MKAVFLALLLFALLGTFFESVAAPDSGSPPEAKSVSSSASDSLGSVDDTVSEVEIDTDEEVPVPVKKVRTTVPMSESRFIRGKDTEGSKALNRFENDSVIQSQYRLNGRSLEVDPD